jgi:hypothetical protein
MAVFADPDAPGWKTVGTQEATRRKHRYMLRTTFIGGSGEQTTIGCLRLLDHVWIISAVEQFQQPTPERSSWLRQTPTRSIWPMLWDGIRNTIWWAEVSRGKMT